jgi:glutathione S-transferase
MIQFYYNPLSGNARRVWIVLLEKQIPFEPILVKLDGDQFHPDFVAINPFSKIPVIIDNGFRVIESLAILDYLEAKYPTPTLMPKTAEAIATLRMVQLVLVNELQPVYIPLMKQRVQLDVPSEQLEIAQQTVQTTLHFLESLLDNKPYFCGENFTLADIVAGNMIATMLPFFGMAIAPYPQLAAWVEKLETRPSWQQTTPDPALVQAALPHMRKILERR